MPIPGPVKISVEGTFTEKPKLIIGGEEVSYERLSLSYIPSETIELFGENGQTYEKTYPEQISFYFSLTANVGQLEAFVSYKVKGNSQEGFVLAKDEECTCTKTKTCPKHQKPGMKEMHQ